MSLDLIRIHNLRNIKEIEFEPGAGLNLIYGVNGSGKTTLLEAIFLLGRGKSFRGKKTGSLIKDGEAKLDLYGRFTQTNQNSLNIGVRKQGKETDVRVNMENLTRLSQLARLVPLQILTPKSHEILERGPEFRRRFIEWGVFHVEHDYQQVYKRFSRVLRQRNAALKLGGRAASSWDPEFIYSSDQLNKYRRIYVERLEKAFLDEKIEIFNRNNFNFKWKSGWREGVSLQETLDRMFESDSSLGFTQSGPQRADLQIYMDGEQITKRVSRGQQKMIVAVLQIAQARITMQYSKTNPIILVDDLPAELDIENRRKLLERLLCLETQLFITAIDKKSILNTPDQSLFHVEHGQINS